MRSASLPIIDLTHFKEGAPDEQLTIAKQTVSACENDGFFYVTKHGIDESLFQKAKESALTFFRKDSDFKRRFHISHFSHHRGYVGNNDVSPDLEKGGDIREAYKVAEDMPVDDPDYLAGITLYGPNVWPEELPEFETDIYRIYQEYQTLSKTIFSLFAVGLNLPLDYFVPLTHKPASVLNVNYYPQSDGGDEASGIGAHSDYEAFAMLWQDGVGGLEIESLQGEWLAVEPINGTLVINIGDLMQHWTNDRFRATRHRVINVSGKERVSMACFGNTNYHAMIECIPSCFSDQNPARYPPKTSGQYLMDAIKRTYAYAN